MEGKLLKNAVIPEVVSLGKSTLVDRCLSKSEVKRLLSMGGCYICELPQSTTPHELSEHEDEKLAPVRRSPLLGSVVGLGRKALEVPLWKETSDLITIFMPLLHGDAFHPLHFFSFKRNSAAKIVQIFGLCKKIILFEASHLFEPISCGIGIFILTLQPEIRK